ncbi:MAG: hypothetical protein M4579_006224 [Chaenotheca gracillima]|nr:MAG: hypothetical protein M4579_006224 [Chaenotheca gracillima]
MAAKRKAIAPTQRRTKYPRVGPTTPNTTDLGANVEGVRQQAEPYRICTARMSVQEVTRDWRRGKNRALLQTHVKDLSERFFDEGVRRDRHLLVACTKRDVENVVRHMLREKGDSLPKDGEPISTEGLIERLRQHLDLGSHTSNEVGLHFSHWSEATGNRAELMVGQHRVAALAECLKMAESEDRAIERWREQQFWLFDFYDRDTLPAGLDAKLRANPPDDALNDTHGRMWLKLIALEEQEPTLFTSSEQQLGNTMREALGISTGTKLPFRRMATLWYNHAWKSSITKWCQVPLGENTFTISQWESMMVLNVNKFWFDIFDGILQQIKDLSSGRSDLVTLGDWEALTRLPRPRTEGDVRPLFFLEDGTRAREILQGLPDDLYEAAYRFACQDPQQRFPDLAELRSGKGDTRREAETFSMLMRQVGDWLSPGRLPKTRSNNKPAERNRFQGALFDRYQDEYVDRAMRLECMIMTFVHKRVLEFRESTITKMLHERPDECEIETYNDRFYHPVWRDLLTLVRSFVGPHLRHKSVAKYNHEDTRVLQPGGVSTITQLLCTCARDLSEIKHNPALNSAVALEALHRTLEPIILQWAAVHCHNALHPAVIRRLALSGEAVTRIDAERRKYDTLLAEYAAITQRTSGSNATDQLELSQPAQDGEMLGTEGPNLSMSKRKPLPLSLLEASHPVGDESFADPFTGPRSIEAGDDMPLSPRVSAHQLGRASLHTALQAEQRCEQTPGFEQLAIPPPAPRSPEEAVEISATTTGPSRRQSSIETLPRPTHELLPDGIEDVHRRQHSRATERDKTTNPRSLNRPELPGVSGTPHALHTSSSQPRNRGDETVDPGGCVAALNPNLAATMTDRTTISPETDNTWDTLGLLNHSSGQTRVAGSERSNSIRLKRPGPAAVNYNGLRRNPRQPHWANGQPAGRPKHLVK